MMNIEEFADGLCAIPEPEFTHEGVLEYLRSHRANPESLERYLYFSPEHYTRNLIRRNALFELIAICWEAGQKSPIHNHFNQRCWMAIAHGRVQVQNFKLIRKDPATRYCELEPAERYIIDADRPAEVDPEEPIHLVANPASFAGRAVTLHVYSRPFDTCEIYDLKSRRYEDVTLTNTSEFGVLVTDAPLEKAVLVH